MPRGRRRLPRVAGSRTCVYTELSVSGKRPVPIECRWAVIRENEFQSPQKEAAMFYGMFLRGHSADELRQEIDIPPKVFQKWMRSREFDDTFRDDLKRMYQYRKQVLAIFNALITSDTMSQDLERQ